MSNYYKPNNSNKNKTWLWVLGWLFIFPLPLTILLLRKTTTSKLTKIGKIAVIVFAWLIYAAIVTSGSGVSTTPSTSHNYRPPSVSDTNSNDNSTATASSDKVQIKDEVVLRFVSAFNTKSGMKITDYEEGNVGTKYYGKVNGYRIEMIHFDNTSLSISINGGQTDEGEKAMFDIMAAALPIVDPSITEDSIDTLIAECNEKGVLIENYSISDNVTVTYVPINTYGCRVDLTVKSF